MVAGITKGTVKPVSKLLIFGNERGLAKCILLRVIGSAPPLCVRDWRDWEQNQLQCQIVAD